MKKIYSVSIVSLLIALFSYFFLDKTLALFFRYDFNSLSDIFQFITKFGKSEFYLIISLVIYIIYRKKDSFAKKGSLLIFSSIAVSGILINIIKPIVARYRPKAFFEDGLYGFSGFDIGYVVNSFPSGHATTSFSLFISLSLLFPKYRYAFYFLAALVAFSRVTIGVHYFSDVIVGSLVGTLTSIYLYDRIFMKKNSVMYGKSTKYEL